MARRKNKHQTRKPEPQPSDNSQRDTRPRTDLRIDGQRPVYGKLFRIWLAEHDACKGDLWVRFDLANNGWAMSLYRTDMDAEQQYRPITFVEEQLLPLVRKAVEEFGAFLTSDAANAPWK